MMPPDREIDEVESRIASRRAQVARDSREAGRLAHRALTSPGALVAAAALGFFAGGGLSRRHRPPPHPERRRSDHLKTAKKTSVAGALTTGAMWLIKAKYGSPLRFAQVLAEKFQRAKGVASPGGDIRKTRMRGMA